MEKTILKVSKETYQEIKILLKNLFDQTVQNDKENYVRDIDLGDFIISYDNHK